MPKGPCNINNFLCPETRSRSQSKKHHKGHDLQPHENNTDSSSTCSLTTIDEEQATHQQDKREEDEVPLLQGEEGQEAERMTGQVLPSKEKLVVGKEHTSKTGSVGKSKNDSGTSKKSKNDSGSSGKWLLESSGEESVDGGTSSSDVTATEHQIEYGEDGEDDWVEIKTSTPTITKRTGKKNDSVKGRFDHNIILIVIIVFFPI